MYEISFHTKISSAWFTGLSIVFSSFPVFGQFESTKLSSIRKGLDGKVRIFSPSKISSFTVLVRQECERQKCERHQCEANSANANSAKGSTVRRDKSANVNSANAGSAMRHRCEKSATAVRMTTVRKRHCAVTCFTGKSPSSGIVKATFLHLCNPFPNHNLTEILLPVTCRSSRRELYQTKHKRMNQHHLYTGMY